MSLVRPPTVLEPFVPHCHGPALHRRLLPSETSETARLISFYYDYTAVPPSRFLHCRVGVFVARLFSYSRRVFATSSFLSFFTMCDGSRKIRWVRTFYNQEAKETSIIKLKENTKKREINQKLLQSHVGTISIKDATMRIRNNKINTRAAPAG